jgi:polyribonucleotide nucleotidyltransferase
MSDQQKLDGLGLEDFKRYMHQYNFPPYSVGEARPLRSPGRREIGHGALAERAVKVMVPPADEFPYVIRIVSEILSSNGSTSMASVCGSTLALMDAGVPLAAPVGGIAMGLVTDEHDPNRYAILSDIQGMEDALGDMDFKVAGTRRGVTALQMDMKARGLSSELFRKALEQARQGRLHILDKMAEALPTPREAMSTYAPRITTIHIHPDKIRDLIGPGGKTIRRIQEETGCQIDIEDDGTVFLATVDEEAMDRAVAMIRDLTESVEVGRIYKGKVVRIMPFGAFVEILPRQDGLVHISQLADQRVGKVEDVVNIGDEIMVKVTEIDDRGRVNLSRKQAILELAGRADQGGNGAQTGDRPPGA